MHAVEILRRLVVGRASSFPYIGEPLSVGAHLVRAARGAEEAGHPRPLVHAALFHDVGHLIAPDDTGGAGASDHARVGACFLRGLGFPERTCRAVELHVDAKRYLVGGDPFYALTPASARTLGYQGGPMVCAAERASFEGDPAFADALALRSLDDTGKCGDLDPTELATHWLDFVPGLLEAIAETEKKT